MSEDKTKEMNDSRSFEERVFARFDAVDQRFDKVDERFDRIEGRLGIVEIRIEKLEGRQYDTKPIWEHVLAAIGQINARLDSMDARLDSMEAKFEARFAKFEKDLDHGFRGIDRKMDVLNKYFLEVRADQRYLESRLEKIESEQKPS